MNSSTHIDHVAETINKYRNFIIHKPFGYLSQFVTNQDKRRNKKLLGELHDFPEGTMAIGRLDEDSEGLFLSCQYACALV